MDRCGGAAARLPESGRKDLAIQALAGTETVSGLAAQHGVSRKFVYAQTGKARVALDGAFLATTPENDVLFNLAVTKTWLHQVIVALPLICHSSYRGVIEFIRDLLPDDRSSRTARRFFLGTRPFPCYAWPRRSVATSERTGSRLSASTRT
jgi:hypothetical protein